MSQKHVHCPEAVQCAATKLVSTLRKLIYEQRLNALRLTYMFYDMRLRGDLNRNL